MLNLIKSNRDALADATPWPVDFVKIEVDPSDNAKTIRLTNHYHDIIVAGDGTYAAAGEFINFGDVADNLEVKDNTLDISLSGVEDTFTAVVLGNPIEGSLVTVSRGFYDEDTGVLFGVTTTGSETAQPIFNRWSGRINNYSITDDYNFTDEDKITISISCKSLLTTLLTKVAGRYTSPQGFQQFNSTDLSMEFVPSLQTFNPNFGAGSEE